MSDRGKNRDGSRPQREDKRSFIAPKLLSRPRIETLREIVNPLPERENISKGVTSGEHQLEEEPEDHMQNYYSNTQPARLPRHRMLARRATFWS